MYPVPENPNQGIFVKEQIDAINKVEPINYDVYLIQGLAGFRSLKPYAQSLYRIPNMIEKNNYDLVHIHYGLSGLFRLFREQNILCVMTLHGGDIQIEQGKKVQVALTKRILKHCDVAITLNDRMDSIAKNYIKETQIIPCGINEDLFMACDRKKVLGNSVNILFPSSRQRYVKDFPLFESTCNVLRSKYNLKVNEFYLENLSRVQVAELYKDMDLMLMTSISEGSPQVVKEAMATNLPVVSTNVGDVSVLLNNVTDSYVASSREPEELASKCYSSLYHKTDKGMKPSEKIKYLGLGNTTIAKRVLRLYHNLTNTPPIS